MLQKDVMGWVIDAMVQKLAEAGDNIDWDGVRAKSRQMLIDKFGGNRIIFRYMKMTDMALESAKKIYLDKPDVGASIKALASNNDPDGAASSLKAELVKSAPPIIAKSL